MSRSLLLFACLILFRLALHGQTADQFFARAMEKYDKHDFDGSIADLTKCIALNPQAETALYNRGLAKEKLGNLDGAEADFQAALKIALFDRGFTALGDIKFYKGDFNGAVTNFNIAIDLWPNYEPAYNERGIAELLLHDYTKAMADLNKAIELNNPVEPEVPFANRGCVKWAMHDWDGAIVDYNKAIEMKPDYFDAVMNRGVAKEAKGNLKEAMTDCNKAIELKPKNAEAYYNRGNVKSKQNDLDGALKDFTEAIRLKPNYSSAFNNRGTVEVAKHDWSGALDDFNEAIESNPKSSNAYANRATVKAAKHDLAEALVDITKAIRLTPDCGNNYNIRGLIEAALGDLKNCKNDFAVAVRAKHYLPDTDIINIPLPHFDSGTITVSADMQARASFNLHLAGVAGQNYILSASTNLVDWTPILTNRNSGATFDFTDTDVAKYGQRFFKIIPIE